MKDFIFKATFEISAKCIYTADYNRILTEDELQEELDDFIDQIAAVNTDDFKDIFTHGVDDYDPNNKRFEITGKVINHD